MKHLLLILSIISFFLGYTQDSLNIRVLHHWYVDTIPNSNHPGYNGDIDNKYNEVWGYTSKGREYGFIGSTLGTHIFDVSDGSNVEEIIFIPGRVSDSLIVHRDFHDYEDYLYIVADEGNSSLQIIDLRFLPDSAPVVYDSDSLIKTSHNIFIDRAAGYLYTCGGTSLRTDIATPYVTSNDLSIYSLKNPLEPELLINCKFDLDFWNEIKYVHDVYVENDIAYCHAGTDGFFIVDFSDTANVQLIGSLTQYPQQGYNHSGWLHQDGTIYAMADETWGTDIKILDVSDLNNIEVIDTIGSNINDSLSMVHNLIFREDYLFVSHFFDGLYIFDLTDPYDIKIAGYYDTSTEPHADRKWQGAWGVYPFLSSGKVLISDMENGFWLFDASNAIVLSESSSPEQSINITIFPNPTSETLFINGLEQGDSNYIISSIKGDIIESGKLYRPYLKLPKNIISGIYFLQIENGDKQFQISFIKED